MKCPRCKRVQADSQAECGGCGLIFSKWKEMQQSGAELGTPRKSTTSASLWAIGLVSILVVVIGYSSSGGTADKTVQASNKESALTHSLRNRNMIEKLCVTSAIETGATELEAQASCGDPKAEKVLQEAYLEQEKQLNFVPAQSVSKVDLYLTPKKSTTQENMVDVGLNLVLSDNNGKPASSEGSLEIQLDAGVENLNAGLMPHSISRNSFRIDDFEGFKDPVVYVPFMPLRVNSAVFQGRPFVTITTVFDGRVVGHSTLYP